MFHTCIKLFTPTPVYVCIYYISGRKWSTTHIAQISQEQDRHNIYAIMKTMWPPCYHINGFVATHVLGTWWTKLQRYIMRQRLDCHIVIVVAGRAHCFHDCINLVPRAILKNSSLSSYSEKMYWGRRFITTAQSVNLLMQMLLVVNQCKLRYNSKIQYLIRFVFDCAVVVNFRSKMQINRIFDIWIKYLLQFAFNHFMYLFYFYR